MTVNYQYTLLQTCYTLSFITNRSKMWIWTTGVWTSPERRKQHLEDWRLITMRWKKLAFWEHYNVIVNSTLKPKSILLILIHIIANLITIYYETNLIPANFVSDIQRDDNRYKRRQDTTPGLPPVITKPPNLSKFRARLLFGLFWTGTETRRDLKLARPLPSGCPHHIILP